MKKLIPVVIALFSVVTMAQYAIAQTLEGTWALTMHYETECPGMPVITQDLTDTVTYTEEDTTFELPSEYQQCHVESEGNQWNLDCTYTQDIEVCVYTYHMTGSGSITGNEYTFQFTSEYTVSGGVGCEFIPACVTTGTIEGVRIGTTSIDNGYNSGTRLIPSSHDLAQNFPNPFNPNTDIRYQIANSGSPLQTKLAIYNVLGQEVAVLVNSVLAPGYYTVTWNGRDRSGREVVSGVYFYRLETGNYASTRRMVLMK
ncbi:MAG: T9SS type A sorting domain-containing protein [Gemmatimonadota bacterium]|nr:MAG: T9SS type A sorting domain-containing protein [Gemmatimonadota bacterium]